MRIINVKCSPHKQAWLCVRTMHCAIAEQCSVQCRSEQRQPWPVQRQYPGNPCVFRSPGPYLMSLSKKKVALSRVFLCVSLSFAFCLSLSLIPPLFLMPPLSIPWSHFANEWTSSVYSATSSVPLALCTSQSLSEKQKRACRPLGKLTTKCRTCGVFPTAAVVTASDASFNS